MAARFFLFFIASFTTSSRDDNDDEVEGSRGIQWLWGGRLRGGCVKGLGWGSDVAKRRERGVSGGR